MTMDNEILGKCSDLFAGIWIWSMIIAVPYSYLGLSLLSNFLKTINIPLEIKLDVNSIPVYFIVTLIVIVLATLPVLFKSKKLSVIEELKYE